MPHMHYRVCQGARILLRMTQGCIKCHRFHSETKGLHRLPEGVYGLYRMPMGITWNHRVAQNACLRVCTRVQTVPQINLLACSLCGYVLMQTIYVDIHTA